MRSAALIIAGFLLTGCAATRPQEARQDPTTIHAAYDYEPAVASALVFPSPIQPPFPLEGLAREPRRPSAFFGYDQQISETYVIVSDDSQGDGGWGGGDGYQRESFSAKVGTVSR